MSEKLTEIIHPDKYVATPLNGLVHTLCKPDHEPTSEEIASLIVKYLYRYQTLSSKETTLSDMTGLFQILEYYGAHARLMMQYGARFDFSGLPVSIRNIFEFSKDHLYALCMLGDVSSTTAIVQAIISQKLSISRPPQHFIGLDIGTGSGILALAQYIMARRNGFRTISVHGIEKNVHVSRRSETVLRSIIPGGIFSTHGADATKEKAYRNLRSTPHSISIEMLPFEGSDLLAPEEEISGRNKDPDPFLPTLLALSRKYHHQLQQVHSFPAGIRAHTGLVGREEIGLHEYPFLGERGVFELCRAGREKIAAFFSGIHVDGVQLALGEDYMKLDEVGSRFLHTPDNPQGWVKLLPLWLHRWRKTMQHNSEYYKLIELYREMSEKKRGEVPVLPPLNIRTTITR